MLTWIASVVLLFLPQVFAIPYVAVHYRNTPPTTELLMADKTLILILVAGVLYAVSVLFGRVGGVLRQAFPGRHLEA